MRHCVSRAAVRVCEPARPSEGKAKSEKVGRVVGKDSVGKDLRIADRPTFRQVEPACRETLVPLAVPVRDSCHDLASLLERSARQQGAAGRYDRQREALHTLCTLQFEVETPPACLGLSVLLSSGLGGGRDVETAYGLAVPYCGKVDGTVEQCLKAGDAMVGAAEALQAQLEFASARRAIFLASQLPAPRSRAIASVRYAKMLSLGIGGGTDTDAALRLAREYCSHGETHSAADCDDLAGVLLGKAREDYTFGLQANDTSRYLTSRAAFSTVCDINRPGTGRIACILLAEATLYGLGVKADPDRAISTAGALCQGEAQAQDSTCQRFSNNLLRLVAARARTAEARSLLEKGSRAGFAEASDALGLDLSRGTHGPIDLRRGIDLLNGACIRLPGSPVHCVAMGEAYLRLGRGTDAARVFESACAKGDAALCDGLGAAFAAGSLPYPVDEIAARRFLSTAVEKGSVAAAVRLGQLDEAAVWRGCASEIAREASASGVIASEPEFEQSTHVSYDTRRTPDRFESELKQRGIIFKKTVLETTRYPGHEYTVRNETLDRYAYLYVLVENRTCQPARVSATASFRFSTGELAKKFVKAAALSVGLKMLFGKKRLGDAAREALPEAAAYTAITSEKSASASVDVAPGGKNIMEFRLDTATLFGSPRKMKGARVARMDVSFPNGKACPAPSCLTELAQLTGQVAPARARYDWACKSGNAPACAYLNAVASRNDATALGALCQTQGEPRWSIACMRRTQKVQLDRVR